MLDRWLILSTGNNDPFRFMMIPSPYLISGIDDFRKSTYEAGNFFSPSRLQFSFMTFSSIPRSNLNPLSSEAFSFFIAIFAQPERNAFQSERPESYPDSILIIVSPFANIPRSGHSRHWNHYIFLIYWYFALCMQPSCQCTYSFILWSRNTP